ncbi:MAG: shikimate kinase [Iamia sp.]
MAEWPPPSEAAPLRPIVLVGLTGSGKSTVGRRMATRLERPFIDVDDELVRRSGRTIREWFAEDGEAGFRVAEADLVADLVAAPGPAVIAAGGGAVVTAATRDLLAERALVVWLRAGVPFLLSRLSRKGHRPLLDDDPEATLTRMAEERSPLYQEVADIVVDVEPFHRDHDKPKRAAAVRIIELVGSAEAALALTADDAEGDRS